MKNQKNYEIRILSGIYFSYVLVFTGDEVSVRGRLPTSSILLPSLLAGLLSVWLQHAGVSTVRQRRRGLQPHGPILAALENGALTCINCSIRQLKFFGRQGVAIDPVWMCCTVHKGWSFITLC